MAHAERAGQEVDARRRDEGRVDRRALEELEPVTEGILHDGEALDAAGIALGGRPVPDLDLPIDESLELAIEVALGAELPAEIGEARRRSGMDRETPLAPIELEEAAAVLGEAPRIGARERDAVRARAGDDLGGHEAADPRREVAPGDGIRRDDPHITQAVPTPIVVAHPEILPLRAYPSPAALGRGCFSNGSLHSLARRADRTE